MQLLHAIGYCFEEAFAELWRNRLVNLVSIGTIAISLVILGIFASLSENLNILLAGWSDKVQVTAYLADDAETADKEKLEALLRSLDEVDSFEFVTKEQAVERFRSYFPELEGLPAMLESNPLPASFEILISEGHRAPEQVHRFADRLKGGPGIEGVDYDLLWIERLTAIIEMVRIVGFFIGGAMIVAAVFTIFNVVKLTVYGRQDEIGIMRLVGATNTYIRGPFLVEGMLQGGLGGGLALGLLYLAHQLLLREILSSSRLVQGTDWLEFLSPQAWAVIVLGGMVVGLFGSTLSVRRFLRGPV
ncbi:MAG TPA: permease-like cell division protein FtsX [Vicinamibacteria bacterium]|nr:permease-like cell division protein FtsX [Vicinamibacteria bacterium]